MWYDTTQKYSHFIDKYYIEVDSLDMGVPTSSVISEMYFNFISFSSLSYDRSEASSKASSPHNAI